ncbi:MAG: beta strand repeat-containing protein, partial [Planctomycetota bacterium]
ALRNILGNNTYSGAITLGSATTIQSESGSTLTLDVASGNAISATNQNLTVSGAGNVIVADAISTGNGTLNKLGSGTLTLSGNNSFSGGVIWGNSAGESAAGVISVGNDGALGTGTLTVRNSGVASNNFIQSSDSTARTIANNITIAGSGINFNTAGTGDLTFTGTVNLGNGTRTFNIGNNITSLAGVVSGSGGITKAGTGTLMLGGSNSFSGVTTISGGTLSVGTINNGGVAGNLGQATNASANVVLNGGTLQYTGATASTDRGMTFNSVAGNTVEVTSAAANLTNSGILTGAGGFTKSGSGTLTLTGSNNYTGNTTVSNGTLQLGNGGSLSTNSAISIGTGAVFSINRNTTTTQGTEFSGSAITGTGGFTQAGSGTTVLTAANSYTGATNVNAGTLRVNGNQIAATGAVTVANGATLGGSGTVGGATSFQSGSTHSPGNSPGLQTFNAGLTYLTGSTVKWELIGNTVSGRGTNFDGIDVTGGALSIQSGVTSNLVFDGSQNGGVSSVFWSDAFWGSNRSWLVYQNTNVASLLSGSIFDTVTITADKGGAALGSVRSGAGFSWSLVGNDVFLNYTSGFAAVPEPGTFGLLSIAGLVGAYRYNRRRKQSPSE